MQRLFILLIPIMLAGCFQWAQNVERGGYHFTKYRVDGGTGVHIGMLTQDTDVDGYFCKGGEWVHFGPDWSLQACFLAAAYEMENIIIPTGTWVMPRADRLIVAFAKDTPCQGYVCGGTGGTKGTHSVFYLDGRLRSFFPPENTEVGTVVCKATLFASVELYPDGQLKACVAAEDGNIGGTAYLRDQAISLDESGKLR